MIGKLSICAVLTALTACANGWPTVHHPPISARSRCTPTGTNIPRADCGTSVPGTSTSQDDIDRAGQNPVPNSINLPTSGQLPR